MKEEKPIPNRHPITGLVADQVASILYNSLVAGWGLRNASKIEELLRRKLKDEKKRRKDLDGKSKK